MPFHDIPVAALPQREIDELALEWRNTVAAASQPRLDIFEVLNKARVELLRRSDMEMGEDEAYACPTSFRIFARDSLLRAARLADLDAIMTITHELGHIVLHR